MRSQLWRWTTQKMHNKASLTSSSTKWQWRISCKVIKLWPSLRFGLSAPRIKPTISHSDVTRGQESRLHVWTGDRWLHVCVCVKLTFRQSLLVWNSVCVLMFFLFVNWSLLEDVELLDLHPPQMDVGLQGLMGVSKHNKAWSWLDGGHSYHNLMVSTSCFTGFMSPPDLI